MQERKIHYSTGDHTGPYPCGISYSERHLKHEGWQSFPRNDGFDRGPLLPPEYWCPICLNSEIFQQDLITLEIGFDGDWRKFLKAKGRE